jgi:Superinfection immunity protein
MAGAGAVVLFSIILGLYFLSTIVAGLPKLKNDGSIFVVNLFLGWTLIGWVIALAWAVSDTAERRERKN